MNARLPNILPTQKHINITLVMTAVETVFNDASDKENPAWLIQWVIKNKLVLL